MAKKNIFSKAQLIIYNINYKIYIIYFYEYGLHFECSKGRYRHIDESLFVGDVAFNKKLGIPGQLISGVWD